MGDTADIYNYIDYREFLKGYFSREKGKNRHFSFRYFARIAGFTSPGFLKMVMDGQRNLSPASINKLSKGVKLNPKESAFFEALVLFTQSDNPKDRDLYFERLSSLKPHAKIHGIEKDQYEYFTQKHYVILREMVALPHFNEDPVWISQHMETQIKPKDVEHALSVLLRLGLIKRNETGRLVQADASLATPPEVHSVEVYNFHREMLDTAKEVMLKVPSEARDVSSLTIPIPLSSIGEIKAKIQNFRDDMMSYVNKGSPNYHEVYQLNIQLFPVTTTKKGK